MSLVQDLIDLCKKGGPKVYVQTHNFPDPDAIGSAFGLAKLLEHFGIEPTLCYAGRIDKLSTSRMLDEFGVKIYSYDEIKDDMKETDPIICVDSQKNGGNILDFIGDEVACVDHHPTFVEETYLYKDVRITGACATLITGYYMELGITPTENVASALLYGLKMDTMQFSRGVTDLDIAALRFLFPLHNKAKITRLEQNTMAFRDLKAYGAAIEHIQVYERFGFTVVPFACPDALIATLADFILALDEVEVVVVISVREDGLKFSVRSEIEQVHAGYLIRDALSGLGNAGGHASMAGGFVSMQNIEPMGAYYDAALRERFMDVLVKMGYLQA
ncbi:MAG: DHH family phosphoesterase [Lachnospiraceae bacterium]|nr:DHH family phosphoesterase [Lachnospiraceae bacterium]